MLAACKPNSVWSFFYREREAIIDLMRPTRSHAAGNGVDFMRGLAPREVYRDCMNCFMHGGLLHRRFILTRKTTKSPSNWRFSFLRHCAVSRIFPKDYSLLPGLDNLDRHAALC